MGTPEFALPSLKILLDHQYHVAAVVTAPDKPRGRGQALLPTPVKKFAAARGLRLLEPPVLSDPAFATEIRALQPDLIVVVAFRILPRAVYSIPLLGSFNLHASLLPRYRGAAPINWAVIRGETETGVTTFFLEDKVDTGGIILQKRVPIGPDEDAGDVHDKLALIGADAVLETVRLIEAGHAVVLPQDNALASPAPKIHKEDCRIAWDQPARRIRNFVRGLAPTPGAFTTFKGKTLKIYRTAEQPSSMKQDPGTLKVDGEALIVSTSEGDLLIAELQPEGKRRMTAAEFLRGHKLAGTEKLA